MKDYPEEYAEIDGRFYLQALLLFPGGYQSEISKLISTFVIQVPHKLKAMLYHKGNYSSIEHAVISKAVGDGADRADMPRELYYEFEAFLFQTKSALDLTIKILTHLFPHTFQVSTFAGKGAKLIQNLEAYRKRLPKQFGKNITDTQRLGLAIKYRNETIDEIVRVLNDERSAWLSNAIDCRDTISHYRGSFDFGEYSLENNDGEIRIESSEVLRVQPRLFMKDTYARCIEFIQDLMCMFIELWLPPLFCITEADDSDPLLREWRESKLPACKYIKYTLASRKWE